MKLLLVIIMLLLSTLDILLILAVKHIDDIKMEQYTSIREAEAYKFWECPRCKHTWNTPAELTSARCPNCGAELREVKDNEDQYY